MITTKKASQVEPGDILPEGMVVAVTAYGNVFVDLHLDNRRVLVQASRRLGAKLLKIKTDPKSDWIPCKIEHMSFGPHTYIRVTPAGRQEIVIHGELEEVRVMLQKLLKRVMAESFNRFVVDRRVENMHPLDVVDYFRKSPDLAYLADEVEKALIQHGFETLDPSSQDLEMVTRRFDISELVSEAGPVWGAQAKIAEVLDIPNAGAPRKRILAVLDKLSQKITTTTPSQGQKAA
jgi:hypothetical protein